MDCARTVKKKVAKEVKVIYRRSREEMPAEQKEIEDAIAENIEFLYQNNIVKIIGQDKVEQLELIKTRLIQKEGEIMKNRKAYAIICWIVAAIAFLAALLISEGKIENVTKQAVLLLVMGLVWLILGIVALVKSHKK